MVNLSAILRDPLKLKQVVTPVIQSWWRDVPLGPPDIILGIFEAFKEDTNPNKVDVSVGAYRDNNGRPYVLKSIFQAEQNLIDKKLDKDYGTDIGTEAFRDATFRLAVGDKLRDRMHVSVQSISGSGSIKIAAETINKLYQGKKLIYISNPSWAYHAPIFRQSGIETAFYRYYDDKNHELDVSGLMTDITHMSDSSLVLFQMCGHNPTATDPTDEQWREISQILKKKNMMIFFDMAYQGFATGSFDSDAFPLRHFIEDGHNVIFAQSYSKNMGLYSIRVGAVTFMVETLEAKESLLGQLKHSALCMYGYPPIFGSRIVEEINGDEQLKALWEAEVKEMYERITSMRHLLKTKLEAKGSIRDWNHLTKQRGMFFYSGMSVKQCESLIDDHSIYLVKNGRMSVPGINENNVDYLADCIHKVTK